MVREFPYFLSNQMWFTRTENEDGTVAYELTDEAPKEARDSFEDYYSDPAWTNEDGNETNFEGYAMS